MSAPSVEDEPSSPLARSPHRRLTGRLRMAPRDQARALGLMRMAVGTGLLLTPSLAVRPWVGREEPRPTTQLVTRAMGIRDIALGLGTVLAVGHGTPVRGWLEAGALVDTSDALTSLLSFRHLTRVGRIAVPLSGAAAALAGRRLARQLS